ncbi:WXG100-like domain-containing protein [Streptomyces sp. NPDC002431]
MLTPSPEAQTLLMVFSGEKWPSINEDLLREAAGYYDKLIDDFKDLQTYLVAVQNYVGESFSGQSAEEFQKYAQYLSGGGDASILMACADQAKNLAKIARDTANQAEYSKWMILGQVIQLMAEMAFEAAVSWIPGLNAVAHANTVAAEITLRIVAQQIIKALIKSIMIHTAMSVVIGEAMDVAIQLIQKGMGNRTEWDLDATKSALGFGALQGLFGGVFSPIGGALGKKIANVVGSDAAKWLGSQIGKHLDDLGTKAGAKAGAGKGLANSLGSILGGTESELVKSLNKSAGKAVTESFVDKVGNAFAKYGFHNLQGDAARSLGKAWASSLNKHWGAGAASDVVSGNIAKDLAAAAKALARNGGIQVDDAALNVLSHTITKDLSTSLSAKGMSEALTRTQKFGYAAGVYGTSTLIDAGAQNLAEGTYNSMTQGEFTTSWQTFVSGVAPTMFSHVMRHTVVHPLIAQSDSGIANLIKGLHTKLDTLDSPKGEFGLNDAAKNSVPGGGVSDTGVPPAPNAGDLVTSTSENGPIPKADPEIEAAEGQQQNEQQSTVPPVTQSAAPVVTQTPAETPTAKATGTPSTTTATTPPNPTNQPGTSRTVTQTQTQTSVSNTTASNAGSTPPIQNVQRRTVSTPPGPGTSELHYGAVHSRPTQSDGTPFADRNATVTDSLMISAEPVTATADNNTQDTVQAVVDEGIDNARSNTDDDQTRAVISDHNETSEIVQPGNSNSNSNSNDNNDNSVQDQGNTQHIPGPNDSTTAPPTIEVTDSEGKKKTLNIPGFLHDVSTYEKDEPIPFKGAVGGHHAVQLTHEKDSQHLANELAEKAEVTLDDPAELSFALANQANTFLGDGRRFVVIDGGRKRELRVKAVPDAKSWEGTPGDAGKLDSVARNQQTEGYSVSDSSTVQAAVTAAITGGGAAAKLTVAPAMGTSRDSNLNTQQLSQHETRSHGPSVKLTTDVVYELSLHDLPATGTGSASQAPVTPEPVRHTVSKGLVVQIPESHTTSSRPDPRKDRVPLKFETESGERADIEHTESYFNIDPMTDWVLQHTDSPIGSANYKAVVNHFSAEHFTRIDGRDPVPPLRLHNKDGSTAGTVTIGTPVPKRHWVIDSATDFELRDTNQFSEKNESSTTRTHTLDISVFAGATTDITGYSEAFATPRAQAGGTMGYNHSSTNTSNLGGTAGAKNAVRSPKDVRTVLVMRESEVTVETPDGGSKTFTVGSLVRMPVGEAQRLAGWDNQEQLRVGTNEPNKPAYWNTGNDGGGKVTMLGPGRPGGIRLGEETSGQAPLNETDVNRNARDDDARNEVPPSADAENRPSATEDAAKGNSHEAEEKLVDSLLEDLRKKDPTLPLATREQVKEADRHRSWFNRILRRDRASVLAVANTRSLMAAVAKEGLEQRMHQAASKEGIRVQLRGSSFTRERGYTLTIRADLDPPTYLGSARRTTTQAFSGGERFDTAQQVTHTGSGGVEATFSALRNEKDSLGAPVATGSGGVNARGTYRTSRQTKSGGTATREDLFAPGPGTDYYDFVGNLNFELQRSSFPQPLIQALTLGGWRALARYGDASKFPAVKWLHEKSGLGGIGEMREDGSRSVFLTPHPIRFTFGVPDGLSKTAEMPEADQDVIAGRAESEVLAADVVRIADEISAQGFTTVTLAARSDQTLFGSVRDLIKKTSGNAWRLTDAGAFMSERVRRIFGQHSFTSLSDQVFSPGGHTVGNLHDKGTLFAGEESLSITGTRHNLKVVGESFTASPETNTALEQAFGFNKGSAAGFSVGTSGAGGGLQGTGDVNFSGQGGVSHNWLQKMWSWGDTSSATSMRDLNQVLGSDRWVMVVADTDYQVAAHHKPLGLFGRPFGSSSDARTHVIRKPGGWVGLMRESDAVKAGLIRDGLGRAPEDALKNVEWRDREGLDKARRGDFAHTAPQDAAQIKKLNEELRKAGVAEQTLHTVNGMVSARSGRSAIQSGSALTSRGRTSALTHVKKLNILGKDVTINVEHRRRSSKVVDTLFADHEFGAGRNTADDHVQSTTASHTHSVNDGETVRGPGGAGGINGTGGGGLGDAYSATDSASGVVTQVTTIPGPKAVKKTEWETVVSVTYADGTDVIEPVKWTATVTTTESYLFMEPKAESDTSRNTPANPPSKPAMKIEELTADKDFTELLKKTVEKNEPAARKGDGGFHIHEVIGADQVQKLGKLLVAKSRKNDQEVKEYTDQEIAEIIGASDTVRPGKLGADALDTALNDISLTGALSSGHAQAGLHTVTVTNNSVIGGVDTTLAVATHLDFKSPKVRRLAVTSQIRFDDLTGSGTGSELSNTTSTNSGGGPGTAESVAKNGVTIAPGIPVAGVNNTSGETHKIGQAEQSRLNLKPPAGHGHLYEVPATFHLAAGSQHHVKNNTLGLPQSPLQSGTTEATVLVWLSDERVKELGLHELTTEEKDAAKAVKQAEEAWEANYKEYWEQRRRTRGLVQGTPEYQEAKDQLERLGEKITEAGEEYLRLRKLTDPMFRTPGATATTPVTFKEEVRHDHGKPKVEDDVEEVAGADGDPIAVTIDGTTHPLTAIENDGNGFFNALAEGFKEIGDPDLPQRDGPELRRDLAGELRAQTDEGGGSGGTPTSEHFSELAKWLLPDLTDGFGRDDVRKAGLDQLIDDPTSKAAKEFDDRGAVPPMKDALTEKQRRELTTLSAEREGDGENRERDREKLTDHGTADYYPALAAALWKVPVTVASGKRLFTFMPDGSEAKPEDVQKGVLLHLKDGTYRHVDRSRTLQTRTTGDDGATRTNTGATEPEIQQETQHPKSPHQPETPAAGSQVTEDEELNDPLGASNLSQSIFETLRPSATPEMDVELTDLAAQLGIAQEKTADLERNLKSLGITRADWYALDGHLARNGSSLSALAASADAASVREAVVEWLGEPVHIPSDSVVGVAQEFEGLSPHHLERLLRAHHLHDVDGLVEAIRNSTPQSSVTEAAHVVQWFATHPDDIARLRDQQDAERLAAMLDDLSLTAPDTGAPHATADDAARLAAFRHWSKGNGGGEHLALTTDARLRDAVARWNLETRHGLRDLPADVDVHALLRLGRAAEAAGATTRFQENVAHHVGDGDLADAVELADTIGHGAGLHEADALADALGTNVSALRPFGKMLGHRFAQHAGVPGAIRATADSFRVDLAHHGFGTVDLATFTMEVAGHTKVGPIGPEELDSFARYLAHQRILGTTPHAAIRGWRELTTEEAAAYVETWRGNDTAAGKVLGTIDVVPPSFQEYQALEKLGPNNLRAFRVQRVELPNGDIRSDVVIPIKLVHEPGQEHFADAARKVARTSLDQYLNAPGYRLSNGDLLHVSVEFVDDAPVERWPNGVLKSPRDGVHLVDLSYGPGSRMEARSWKLPSDHLSVFAHEMTHLLGPWDYYREHANTLRPVYTDRALMGGPVYGDHFGNVAVGSLHPRGDRLHNQRMMPRDLRLLGSAIERTWKSAGHPPAPHDGLKSKVPLHVAERVVRGDPSTGKAGHLAPVGTAGRVRPVPLGDINPNGTYRAAGGGHDDAPIMMFPDHWSLEEVTEAAVHVHRDQLRHGNIGPDGAFEGVHHGVRIRGHARPDGTITDFEPSDRQDDLAPRPLADPAFEPKARPFTETGNPASTHRLWDFLEIGARSNGTGGHVLPPPWAEQEADTAPSRKAVIHDLFTDETSRGGARRGAAYSLELTQDGGYQDIRSLLTSPGPAVAFSDGVSGLNTLFPEEWDAFTLEDAIDGAHRGALESGNFTVLPSGGYIWHGLVMGVLMHGQVLDGEHQWIRPSTYQLKQAAPGSHRQLAVADGIEFHTADGAHYRMRRILYGNGEQETTLFRILHLSPEDSASTTAESLRGTQMMLGPVPGLGLARVVIEVGENATGHGNDTDLLDRAGNGAQDARSLLGSGFDMMTLSAPRGLTADQWSAPAGTTDEVAWRAHVTAVLDRYGPNALSHEPGVDALVRLHTAEGLAPHADRVHSERQLVAATDRLFRTGAGNDLDIPEALRGDWTADRVRLAALQYSSHGHPVAERSGPGTLVTEAFPEPGVLLEIRHELGEDGQWKIADYTIRTHDGTGAEPLWQPDEGVAQAAADMGVHPGHLAVLSGELRLTPQELSSAAALLRGLGDPQAVVRELRLMADRLGIGDARTLTMHMSAFAIGAEHWWDLAAHLQNSGHTLPELINTGPGGDLHTAWQEREQLPVPPDVVTKALALGVHPRRLEMVMNAALISDLDLLTHNVPWAWEGGLTPHQTAEQLFGQAWVRDFDTMAAGLGISSDRESLRNIFTRWLTESQAPELRGFDDLTRALALWRIGRQGPADGLPDGSDPRPLALVVSALGVSAQHANVFIEGPGRESGPLPMATHLEQRHRAAEQAGGQLLHPVERVPMHGMPVLQVADALNIDPHLVPSLSELVLTDRETFRDLLWDGADPFAVAGLVIGRLDGLGLDPDELAWFQGLSVTQESVTGFWEYVAEHRDTDPDLAALLTGDRQKGPEAVRKWVAHHGMEPPATTTAPATQQEPQGQNAMAHHASAPNGPPVTGPHTGQGDPLPDTLLALAKQLSSAGVGDRTGLADAELFQGSTPVAREAKLSTFRGMVDQAGTVTDLDERAARIASDIKSSQYFTDGNTRTATTAVFLTYAAAGAGLGATPLEVFAAIGEAEVNPRFDLTEWLREHRTDDGPATVPSPAELERISVVAGQLAFMERELQRIGGYWREYLSKHLDESAETAEADFLGDLLAESEPDYDLWTERAEFARAIDLIRPGGKSEFLGTVSGQRAPEEGETFIEEIERLMEELGFDD